MIKERLELLTGPISNALFIDIMDVTTKDIKLNGVYFRQRTNFEKMIEVAKITFGLFKKCEERQLQNKAG